MAKKQEEKRDMTMEEYLLAQLDQPVLLKDGSAAVKPESNPNFVNYPLYVNH